MRAHGKMKLFISAKAKVKNPFCEKVDETHFIVAVKEPPAKGQANVAIAEALAEHFGIAYSRVRILSGFSSRQKVFEVV